MIWKVQKQYAVCQKSERQTDWITWAVFDTPEKAKDCINTQLKAQHEDTTESSTVGS